jgi:hypothetical protein
MIRPWIFELSGIASRGEKLKNLLALLTLLAVCNPACPAELFGSVDALSGHASVSDPGGKPGNLSTGQKIYTGQTLTTTSDGEVQLVTQDGGIIALRPDTTFRVDDYRADGGSGDRIFMSLLKGAVRSITGWIGKHDTSAYRLTTPTATIGIRGTDHETTVIENAGGDEPGTYDTVNEGSTVMKTPQGETAVTPGKFAFVPRNRSAAPSLLARQPQFWARRKLKIESRIQQRKDYYRNRLDQMREQRIQRMGSGRAGRRDERRLARHPAPGRQAPGRNKVHERRSAQDQQARQQERRAAYRQVEPHSRPARERSRRDRD